ncbi:DUF4209 domain-containing protein [Streptomyces sp. NPDC088847]|uniref:DUF4209 domain-containing protein n=1 Tax=Streptomyces sp. NPDC088847 TaxID=3365909 RepID=UPI0038106C03
MSRRGTLGSRISRGHPRSRTGYPRDWSRALELLLVDPDRGMNLRNYVCHGLVDTPPKHHIALIFQATLYLLSYAHAHRTTAPPTHPLNVRPIRATCLQPHGWRPSRRPDG